VDASRDFRAAAALARAVRRNGHTVRSLTDCLIASLALRHGATVWHCDEDFVRIADVAELQQRNLR
jgi:predicted nucleic acid-binding protein